MNILVMLSTYNSQDYLNQQLDTILNQEDVHTRLFIRDDGSSDNTVDILQSYIEKYPNRIKYVVGENVGPSVSMYKLVNCVENYYDISEFSYFSFADHDDYWLPNKLIKAVEKLNSLSKTSVNLYFSNLYVTDSNLNVKFKAYENGAINPTKKSVFVNSSSSGNTFVFNLFAFLNYKNTPYNNRFYGDVWFYIRCIFLGNVVYDNNSYIYFRRTGKNASGSRKKGISLFLKRLSKLPKIIFGKEQMKFEMAIELLNLYGDFIDGESEDLLKLISNYKNSLRDRMKLFFSRDLRSTNTMNNFLFRIRIIFGRI